MDENTQAIIRHLLATAGGALVSSGVITGAQEQDALGAIVALVAIGWSIYNKRQHKQALLAAQTGAQQNAK